jgi:F-type H+-transporting ATPase subunit b
LELNWTTVVLEMVNFLVLVWILKRFLYRPVLQVIEERRARVEATLSEARQRQEEADELRSQYENRIAEWQREKQAARETFQREIQQQRGQALEALEATLAAAREKARVLEERRWREFEEGAERKGLELGARFAGRLLEKLAGPEFEDRILPLLAQGLAELPDEQRSALRRAAAAAEDGVRVETAHPLSSQQRDTIAHAVQDLLGAEVRCRFEATPALIAGLRLSLGDWSLGLNLRDELKGFVDTARAID